MSPWAIPSVPWHRETMLGDVSLALSLEEYLEELQVVLETLRF